MKECDSEPVYIHGTSVEEQARLSALNGLINEACLRELKIGGGERILDVGSGLMQFTRLLARAAGKNGAVVAIESSDEQRAEAMRQARAAGEEFLVDLRAGDAYEFPLRPGQWGTFDVVHARFLLEHLSQPERVVAQMVKTARPGGRIILADDDHHTIRLSPPEPEFDALWCAYIRTYEAAGCDPYIGRRLVTLLHRAGAHHVRNTHIFFGSCAGQTSFQPLALNVRIILEGAREAIERLGFSAAAFAAGMHALERWRTQPDAALWYSICWAEGLK